MALRDELLALETEFWEAAGDPGYYREHFSEDGLMALPVGIVDKEAVVASMEGAEEWSRFTFDDPRLVELSDDVAALVYGTEALHATPDTAYQALITSVYARRDGRWMLVLHQQTPV